MLYPVSKVYCGLNHVGFFSNYIVFQQLTKLLFSLHTSLLLVGRWTKKKKSFELQGENKSEI